MSHADVRTGETIAEHHPCPRCGLDLRGLAVGGACPDCGEVILGSGGALSEDLECVRCGYNLRGLNTDGVCPECAAPVAWSLTSRSLIHSDRDYIRTVRTGSLLTAVAALAGFLFPAFVGALAAASGGGSTASSAQGLTSIASGGLFLLGYWMIAAPNPADEAHEQGWTARRLLRTMAPVGVVFVLIGAIQSMVGPTTSLRMAFGALGVVAIPFWLLIFFASMRHTRGLARRLPDQRKGRIIDRLGRWIEWGAVAGLGAVVLLMGAGFLIGLLAPVMGGPGGMMGGLAAAGIGFVVFALGLILYILFIIYFLRLHNGFRWTLKAIDRAAAGEGGSAPSAEPMASGGRN